MSDRVITWIIIGVAFGFTQLWFAYWVVKLLKERQRILKARRAAAGKPMVTSPSRAPVPARRTARAHRRRAATRP